MFIFFLKMDYLYSKREVEDSLYQHLAALTTSKDAERDET